MWSLIFSVDSGSYEIYEDVRNLDKKFEKISPMVLKLKPKDVKKFGISKQTLWNVKMRISKNQFRRISTSTKLKLLYIFNNMLS